MQRKPETKGGFIEATGDQNNCKDTGDKCKESEKD
jgi:hypothetical protein